MARVGRVLATAGKLFPVFGVLANRLRFPGLHCGVQVEIMGEGALLHGVGASIGAYSRIYFDPGGALQLGDGVGLGRDVHVQTAGSVRIGSRTGVNDRARLYGNVAIGRGCAVGPNLFAASGAHLFRTAEPWLPLEMQHPQDGGAPDAPVTIHDDCWIGINVVVTPGVTIGRGAVIGANAVVNRDVPPYEVWGGVPARRIGERLPFKPPAAVDSARAEDRPYFYSGFAHVARDAGGHRCDPVFILALGQNPTASRIRLRVSSTAGGGIAHGGQRHGFTAGQSDVVFLKEATDAPFHAFRLEGDCRLLAALLEE